MIRYAFAAAALFSASTTHAGPGFKEPGLLAFTASDTTTFSAEDMTGPAQTSVVKINGLDYVELFVSNLAVTGTADVTVDCYTGYSSTTATYHVQSEAITAGDAVHSDYTPKKSVTTAKDWLAVIPVHRASHMYCTFTCASGTVDLKMRGGNY